MKPCLIWSCSMRTKVIIMSYQKNAALAGTLQLTQGFPKQVSSLLLNVVRRQIIEDRYTQNIPIYTHKCM